MPKEVQTILDANNILTEKSKVVNTQYMQNSRDYSFDRNERNGTRGINKCEANNEQKQITAAPVTRASQRPPRNQDTTVLKVNITQFFLLSIKQQTRKLTYKSEN